MESVEEQRQHLVITSFTEDRLVKTNRMKVNLLIWSETSTECKIFQDRPFGKWGGGIHFRWRTGRPSILLSVSAVCSIAKPHGAFINPVTLPAKTKRWGRIKTNGLECTDSVRSSPATTAKYLHTTFCRRYSTPAAEIQTIIGRRDSC